MFLTGAEGFVGIFSAPSKFHMKSANLFSQRPSVKMLFSLATLLPFSALAAGPTVSQGVLLMGFRSSDPSLAGNGQYVVVNIGQAANYRSGTAATITNINTQLGSVFGSEWSARTDLQWGVAGCPTTASGTTFSGDSANTFYVSRSEATQGTPDVSPLSISTPTKRATIASNITNIIGLNIAGGFDDSTAGSNALIGLQSGSTPANNWRSYMGGANFGGNGANATSNQDLAWDTTGIETTPNKTLSLYRFAGATSGSVTGTYLGYLKIESNGNVSFNPVLSYSSWATTNAGGAAADLDSDKNGVANGIQWFTGLTSNPQAVSGTITWPRASGNAAATSVYVQTSTNLTTWTNQTANLATATGSISYSLPTGQAKIFARLLVTP